MAELLSLDLVTPERLALSADVEMVVVPGVLGDMGIMAWHAPIISPLRPGVVEVHRGGAVAERYFAAGGYVEVHDNRCTVLAEELTDIALMNPAAIEADIEQMQRQVDLLTDPLEKERLVVKLATAEAQKLALAA